MSNPDIDKREITPKTFRKGTFLERPGKTAKVLGAAFKKNEFRGYQCLISEVRADETTHEYQCVLSIKDLKVPPGRGGWKLRTSEPETVSVKLDRDLSVELDVESLDDTSSVCPRCNGDEFIDYNGLLGEGPTTRIPCPNCQKISVEPLESGRAMSGNTYEAKWHDRVAAFLRNAGIVSFFGLKPGNTPREWHFITNLMTGKSVGERLVSAGCYPVQIESNDGEIAGRAWSAKAWFALPANFFNEAVPEVNTPSTDDKLEALRISYYDARFAAGEQDEAFPSYLNWLEDSLLKQREFGTQQFDRFTSQITNLGGQLAQARTLLSSIKTFSQLTADAGNNDMRIMRDIQEEDFVKMLGAGWAIFYMEFTPTAEPNQDHLNVIFTRSRQTSVMSTSNQVTAAVI